MRLVQVTIPAGKREAILSALDDEGIDYVVHDETSGREYTAVVTFPLPTHAVEPVLERLREAGVERDAYTVVVDAETVVSKKFERLEERYEEDGEGDTDRIAREELKARAQDLAPTLRTYVVMTIVSVVIATAGLLLDSPAVVVGSMVIAPLIGPSMATNVGTVLDDRDLFFRGLRLQVLGILLAIATATVFAFFVKYANFVPPGLDIVGIEEIRGRISPDFLSLAIALGAGIAGAVSLRSGVSASLVGVMIAVALVPPTAVIGIGIAWWSPMVVLGSAVLVLVNILSINLAALATFWWTGYRPERWFDLADARSRTVSLVGGLVVALLVLSVALGGITYRSYQQAVTEDRVVNGVESVVADSEATLLEVTVVNDRDLLREPIHPHPERVIVIVGIEGDRPPPNLAERIADRIAFAGSPVVQVRYVEVETAGGDRAATETAGGDRAALDRRGPKRLVA